MTGVVEPVPKPGVDAPMGVVVLLAGWPMLPVLPGMDFISVSGS